MYAELPLVDALRTLHECGWCAFEISTEHLVAIETGRDPDALVDQAKAYMHNQGLFVPQSHALLPADVAHPDKQHRERDLKRLETHVDLSVRMGVRDVIVHPGGRHAQTQSDRASVQKLNIEAFRRLGDFAGERDARICMENMPSTEPGFTTPAEILELLKLIDHSAISINIDTSHLHMSNLDVAQVVRELGPYIAATHISDNDTSGDQHLIPGGGTIDWLAVMDAFRGIGYKGLFNLEIPGDRHALLGLRHLKSCFAFDVATWLVGLAEVSGS